MSNRRKTTRTRRPRPGTHAHIPPACPDQSQRQSVAWAVEHVTRCDYMGPGAGLDDCGAPAVGWIECRPRGQWQAFGYCRDHGGDLGADLLSAVMQGHLADVREGDAFSDPSYRVCLGGPDCDER